MKEIMLIEWLIGGGVPNYISIIISVITFLLLIFGIVLISLILYVVWRIGNEKEDEDFHLNLTKNQLWTLIVSISFLCTIIFHSNYIFFN